MHAEILRTPPMSGTFVEHRFDVSAHTNTWVRFEDDEGNEWVGVFGRSGYSAFDAVVPFAIDGGRTVLVVAGGQGYVVDARTGSLVRRTRWFGAEGVVAVPDQDFVLVADATEIWVADRARDLRAWRHDRAWYDSDDKTPATRVALDGIVFDHVTSSELTGKVWEMDGWYAYRVRLPDLEFTRGERVATEWETFAPTPPAG
jgi:hypothetical protein